MDSTAWKESQRGSGGGMYCERCADREEDLKALVKKWPESIPTDEIEALLLHTQGRE